uniref:Putative trypsin-like peptidase domain containing protein n=1 Tax=viral metagenome TaxID=1070528 RepID=A0A6M3XMR6_9ZZZZ
MVGEEDTLEHINKLHSEILWTTVRIRAAKAWGSGTLIYSMPDGSGKIHTYVLTCHHVVADNIKVEEKWDPQVGMDVKKEVRTPVEVQLFYYEKLSHAKGLAGSYRAWIRVYDADQDIALLELDKTSYTKPIAFLFPRDMIEEEVHVFDVIYAVGAAMAHEPIATKGIINFMDEIIDDYEYWMGNAPTIFGNSGGAVFRFSRNRKRYEFIGMPARITVNLQGFSADPITHMGYFVPISRIYKVLESNYYQFIYDEKYTYESCEIERKKSEEEARKLFMAKFGTVKEKVSKQA